jgi:hypothetical protein
MKPVVTAEPLLSPQENYNLLKTEYIKSQQTKKAEEFKNNIKNGTANFARQYMLPATKTVASLNPITGVAIGMIDAEDKFSKGLYAASLFGVGLEALPYGGKYIGKAVKPILKNLKRDAYVSLKLADIKAGSIAERFIGKNTLQPKTLEREVNQILSNGVGVKKLDLPINLSYSKKESNILSGALGFNVNIGGDNTGVLRVSPILEQRTLSDIIKRNPSKLGYNFDNANKKGGFSLIHNYPFGQAPEYADTFNPFFEVYSGKGIDGEIKKSFTRALNNRGLGYYSSSGNKSNYSVDFYNNAARKGIVRDITAPRVDRLPVLPANRLWEFVDKKQSGGTLQEKINKRFYNGIDPTLGYPDAIGSIYHLRNVLRGNEVEKAHEPVSDAAWRKRLGLAYDKNLLPENIDGSVRLPKEYEAQIQTDTTAVKNKIRINSNKPDKVYRYIAHLDQIHLDNLRRMYNNRDTIPVGEIAG